MEEIQVNSLRPYQEAGIAWIGETLRARRAAILADEMGLGKTRQAIEAAQAAGATSVVVVCPAIAVPQWWAQLERWGAIEVERHPRRKGVAWRGRVGVGVSGFGGQPAAWRVYSFEGFAAAVKAAGAEPASKSARWVALPAACDFLIIDELHHLMSEGSARSKACREARGRWNKPPTLALSGTPMTARPRDLWNPLDLLFGRRVAGSFWTYTKRFCAGFWKEIEGRDRPVWDSSGASNLEELRALLQPLMLRRLKSEVAEELPAITRSVHEVELPGAAAKEASIAARELSESLLEAGEWGSEMAVPARFGAGIARLLSGLEAHKLTAAADLARELVAEGSRPLLLTTRVESARQLGEMLCCPAVSGETHPNAEARRAALLSGSGPGVATLFSVLEAIDLIEFDAIVFVGLDWVPSRLLQAEARAHRLGQRRGVSVFYLVCLGTLDELVRDKVIERLDSFNAVIGGDQEAGLAGSLRGGSEEELLAALVAAAREGAEER